MHLLKYVKPLRLPIRIIQSRRYLTEEQTDEFFKNRLIVEEKMDGIYGMYKIEDFLLHFEDLLYSKTIRYRVPARYALFDIYDLKNGLILSRKNRMELFSELSKIYYNNKIISNMFVIPIITHLEPGFDWRNQTKNIAGERSKYSQEMMEGVVFKIDDDVRLDEDVINYRRIVNAKFVNAEFYGKMGPEKITGRNIIDVRLRYQT